MRAAVLLLSIALACSDAAVDEAGFAAAAGVGSQALSANAFAWVDRLSEAHAADVKVSCEGFAAKEGFPSCELSRDAAVAVVLDAFGDLGLNPRIEVLGEAPHATLNVVAELPGVTRPSEVVLLGAHLDAFFAGADDNSSGVAAMLEAARTVAQRRFARTIRFVAFDLEEYGAIGSTRYVEAGRADDVVAALVLECVGYASTAPGSQKTITGMPLGNVGDFLLVAANEDSRQLAQQTLALNHFAGGMKLKGVVASGDGSSFASSALMRSDHGLMWLRGIPALLFSDTANFRNPHYHLPTDTPETLDPAFLGDVTRTTASTIALFAEVQP